MLPCQANNSAVLSLKVFCSRMRSDKCTNIRARSCSPNKATIIFSSAAVQPLFKAILAYRFNAPYSPSSKVNVASCKAQLSLLKLMVFPLGLASRVSSHLINWGYVSCNRSSRFSTGCNCVNSPALARPYNWKAFEGGVSNTWKSKLLIPKWTKAVSLARSAAPGRLNTSTSWNRSMPRCLR